MHKLLGGGVLGPLLVFGCIQGILADAPALDPRDMSGRQKLIALTLQPLATELEAVQRVKAYNMARDLQLDAVAAQLHCATSMGRAYAAEALAHPLSSSDTSGLLERRRNLIRTLVANNQLRTKLGMLLASVQQCECGVAELLSDYFRGSMCTELQIIKNLDVPAHERALLPPATLDFLENHVKPTMTYLTVNPTGRTLNEAFKMAATAYAAKFAYRSLSGAYANALNGAVDVWGISWGGFNATALVGEMRSQWADYRNAAKQRARLRDLHCIAEVALTCDALCRAHGCGQDRGAEAQVFFQRFLGARCLAGGPLLLTKHLVHVLLYDVYQHERDFSLLFACLAELDVCHAIACAIATAEEGRAFCIAEPIEASSPLVATEGFWNVLLAHAVPNDATLEDAVIIITGPNAGGKTVAMRALLQNIVLAQTFGVAAARTFRYTPFTEIRSYLNVSDNLLQGASRFAAELQRAKEILLAAQNHQREGHLLVMLDELFTGTASADGEACAGAFVRQLSACPGALCLYTTHFSALADLALVRSRCTNYHVGAPEQDATGVFKYPFTFMPGASRAHVAMDMARQAGLLD